MMKTIKKYWLLTIGILIIIFAIISYFVLDQKAIGFISFSVGIASAIVPFLLSYYDNKTKKEYEKIIDDYRNRYEDEVNRSKKLQSEKEKLRFEKTEYRKFLDKINETLKRENISKSELMKGISSSLKAIVFFKTWEDTIQKRALFVDKAYPDIGVICIRSGLSILPPRRVPQEFSNKKIIKWFKKELEKRVPKGYEYNIAFITVINLIEATYFRRLGRIRERGQFSFLDKIPIEELLPAKEVINYLKKKKNLSPKDIIEIPNIVFLVEDYMITKSDYEKLKKNNEKIIKQIKKKTKSEELKTTDLASVDLKLMQTILRKYVSDSKKIAERVKSNASFWKDYFEHRLKVKRKNA